MNAAPAPLGSVILESDASDYHVTLRRPGQWPVRQWFASADQAEAAATNAASQHDLPLIRLHRGEID